jgi:hypothetical protein
VTARCRRDRVVDGTRTVEHYAEHGQRQNRLDEELVRVPTALSFVCRDSPRYRRLGSLKTSKVGDYRCRLFSFEGCELRVLRRSVMKQAVNPPFDYQNFSSQVHLSNNGQPLY